MIEGLPMEEKEDKPESEEKKAWYRAYDVKTGKLAVIGIVGILLLVIAMYLTNQYFLATTQKQVERVMLEPTSPALQQLHAHEDSILNFYQMIDSTKRIYSIPIQKAMEMMADSAQNAKPESIREH